MKSRTKELLYKPLLSPLFVMETGIVVNWMSIQANIIEIQTDKNNKSFLQTDFYWNQTKTYHIKY